MIDIKLKYILTVVPIVSLILQSCTETSDTNSHIASEQLFRKSLILLSAYTDSLNTARDSTHVESLARAFESKINAINFEFPPDTDLKLSQEENDSLIKMTDLLVNARRSRLKWLSNPLQDSIPPMDSVSIKVTPPSHSLHN